MFFVQKRKPTTKRLIITLLAALTALVALYGWVVPKMLAANDFSLFIAGLVLAVLVGPLVVINARTSLKSDQ